MYYFSKQAGRFKDYCVVWFDINLLIVCVQYFRSCGNYTFIQGFLQFWMDFKFKLIYNHLFQWRPRIKKLTIQWEKWPVNTGLHQLSGHPISPPQTAVPPPRCCLLTSCSSRLTCSLNLQLSPCLQSQGDTGDAAAHPWRSRTAPFNSSSTDLQLVLT